MSMSEYIKHCRHFDGLGMGDAELESQAKALEAKIDELEEWTILRCNELGDQIKKRDKRIEEYRLEHNRNCKENIALEAKVDALELLDKMKPLPIADCGGCIKLQAKVDELTDALQNLVDYYVKNPDTKSEFVTTVSGGSDPNAKHVVLFREARAALKQEKTNG